MLLFRLVSDSTPLTVAELTSVPLAAAATSARIVIVACPPSARLPKGGGHGASGTADAPLAGGGGHKDGPLGSVSTTFTPVAPDGPALVTVRV